MDLPTGITEKNGEYYNAHGMNVTIIASVFADSLRKYDYSVEFLKKYDGDFKSNHSGLVNAVETIGSLHGEKIQVYLSELVEEFKEYAFSVSTSDKPVLIQFFLIEEIKRVLDTVTSLEAILSTLKFDYNVSLH